MLADVNLDCQARLVYKGMLMLLVSVISASITPGHILVWDRLCCFSASLAVIFLNSFPVFHKRVIFYSTCLIAGKSG